MEDIITKFQAFTHKPVKFLEVQNDINDDLKGFVKTLYDFTKSHETRDKIANKNTLPEIIVDEFDNEQIWQQIELQNTECWDQLVWDVANCVSSKNNLEFPIKFAEDIETKTQQSEEDLTDEEVETEQNSELEENMDEEEEKPKKVAVKQMKQKGKSSVVDDQFFKLNEMEQFLLKEEKGKKVVAADSDEESIDYFEDIDESEHEEEEDKQDMMYSDFFDGENGEENEINEGEGEDDEDEQADYLKSMLNKMKQKEPDNKNEKKVTFADAMSNDESSENEDNGRNANSLPDSNDKKSDFELRQQRLQQTITRLEEKSLKEAPWQLKGEVNALKRPQNSLLEEVVDFDLTSRPPPLITEETTLTLEDLIRQRIKDKAWDDVEKKQKPVDDQLAFRKTEILDHSKSKLSLAQVYESEYLKQKQALSGDAEEEKEPESHTEIRRAMSNLFSKLDALCNYHYTPKAPQAEVKIVSNTPAISMEEVAPVATSDATLLAPEEVKKKSRGELLSKDERSQTDKNRERRKKKKLQRKKGGIEKVTDHRNTKKAVEAGDKSLKTSRAFFQQLNDDATSVIKKKNKLGAK